MKISKLQKEALLDKKEVRLTVEITIDTTDIDYQGFDLFPDELIPDVLVAVGRKYSNKIKKGKIKDPCSTIR